MSYTIAQLKTDLTGRLHGTTLNKITGVYDLITRAARQLLLDLDPAETRREAQLSNALFDEVTDYVVPEDLKGDRIIDIYPQVNRSNRDSLQHTYSQQFDMFKSRDKIWSPKFTVKHNTGIKTIRIAKSALQGVRLHDMGSLTANGTWSAGGGASNLAVDTIQYVQGASSISFDVTGATTSYIENSTLTAQDLSSHELRSSLFVWVYLPSASSTTDITLRWGSSDTAYFSKTVTASHTNSVFINGWNLLRFDWSSATETGSVTTTAIDYLRLSMTHTAAMSGVRVDNIISNMPSIWEIYYYSKYLFSNSAGVWKEVVSADSDYVNLDTESYDLLLDICEYLAFRQLSNANSSSDAITSERTYQMNLKRYKQLYKSEVRQTQQIYYRIPKSRISHGFR